MNFNQGRRGMNSSGNDRKPRDTKYVLKRLWNYLFHFKGLLFLALLLTIATNVFSLIGPSLSAGAIDAIDLGQGKVDFNSVFLYGGLMIIFYILAAIFSYILSRLMINISRKIIYKMREDAFKKIQELSVSYFDSNQIGDIISKMSYDIDTINTSLSSDLIQICTSIITVFGSLIAMLLIEPLLVLVFVVTIPISLLFTRYMLKRTKKLFRARSAKLGELNGYVEEMITGIKTIKAYTQESNILGEFDEQNIEATAAAYKAEYYGSFTGPAVNFVNNLSLALVCVFGSLMLTNAKMLAKGFTVGKLGSFILYSRKFSGPINEVANIFVDLQSAMAAAERVFGLIDSPSETADKTDAVELESVQGNIEFNNVEFGYVDNKVIIHNLNVSINKGNVIAIVGPTGAGKTTIVNLLMRFYDVNKGDIFIDKKSVFDITRRSLRKSYAMVLQDTWLFQGTVYENIAYGKENATMDEVVNACKAARIHGFIKRLPKGYDTILTEGGTNISKGQKQLLTIARAMLLDANMLILDEATSNVDTRTEIQIQEAMKELMKNKTCFIIAHRLSTIRNADLILVVNNGEIVEQGNHNELIIQNGFYNKLYYSQFE